MSVWGLHQWGVWIEQSKFLLGFNLSLEGTYILVYFLYIIIEGAFTNTSILYEYLQWYKPYNQKGHELLVSPARSLQAFLYDEVFNGGITGDVHRVILINVSNRFRGVSRRSNTRGAQWVINFGALRVEKYCPHPPPPLNITCCQHVIVTLSICQKYLFRPTCSNLVARSRNNNKFT